MHLVCIQPRAHRREEQHRHEKENAIHSRRITLEEGLQDAEQAREHTTTMPCEYPAPPCRHRELSSAYLSPLIIDICLLEEREERDSSRIVSIVGTRDVLLRRGYLEGGALGADILTGAGEKSPPTACPIDS